jgi:CelD/BcsL family acetyltransferase involved in cellulose biosynthesis
MNVHLVRGKEAATLCRDAAFQADWRGLCERCPWATAFQYPEYATVWYDVYRRRFEPVLVLAHDARGELIGLLPLASPVSGEGLIVAGGRQAEYQAWICAPDIAADFPRQAFRAVQHDFPQSTLTVQYLPPGTPVDWLGEPDVQRMTRLSTLRRLVVRFDRPPGNESSLSKKKTRYRLKQIEKLGKVEFTRITQPQEFEALLDTIIPLYDFRQEAAHGIAPFRSDSLKKELVLARVRRGDARLHATVLKVGDQVASAHLGFCSRREVHLGLLAHNPFLAKHSPGKFHLLFLAQMLAEEGFARLDLTPGDDPYKDHFANDCDEAHVLTLYPSAKQQARVVVRERLTDAVRKGIRLCRIEPEQVRSLVHKVRSCHPVHTPLRLMRDVRQWIGTRSELRIYSLAAARAAKVDGDPLLRLDDLSALLAYHAEEPGPSRQQFLAAAWDRFEAGWHVCTHAQNDRLQHFGWLAPHQERIEFGADSEPFALPPGSRCLFDYYTAPQARRCGLFTRSLRTLASLAARLPGTERIFTAVPAEIAVARHVVEQAGFVYEGSLFAEVQFGRKRGWVQPA